MGNSFVLFDVSIVISHGHFHCGNRGHFPVWAKGLVEPQLMWISIYTLSDLDASSNLIGSLSLANEHYSPPTE